MKNIPYVIICFSISDRTTVKKVRLEEFDAGRKEKSSERQLAFAFVRFEQEIGCHTEPPHSSYAPSKLVRERMRIA